MNREEIIRMAREQGDFIPSTCGDVFILSADPRHPYNIFKFADLVAAAEREACAKVCEQIGQVYVDEGASTLGQVVHFAAAIRARGQE